MVLTNAEYLGSIALHHPIAGPPVDVTALVLTCWDNSFVLHGIQPLPTPPPSGRIPPMGNLEVTTDTGSKHQGRGAGGHGHPHFLWHATFEPALAPDISSVTLCGTTDTAAINTLIQLPHWPPARYDASTQAATTASAPATLRLDRPGRPLPDRVVALSADLGLIAGVRCALTSLYCWPSWFLMTLEAAGDQLSVMPRAVHQQSWDMEDDRRNRYVGRWIGGWSGQDNGAHIAFAPRLDPQAREFRLSFTDPFGRAGRLAAVVAVPGGEQSR